jgi:hypothetical protein
VNKRTLSFVLGSFLVILTLFFIPFCSKRLLAVPKDANHAVLYQEKDKVVPPSECLRCHGPKGVAPRSKSHPQSDQCLYCHAVQ